MEAHDEARECLLDIVLGATTLDEIATAQQALREWMKAYPEEEGMCAGFEQLSLMEDAANMQEAEHRWQVEDSLNLQPGQEVRVNNDQEAGS